MAITRRDKKLIFHYLTTSPDGLHFGRIWEPEPKPVMKDGCCMLDSVREVESPEAELYEYWEELKRTGLIRPVDRDNPEWFVLTAKGKNAAQAEDYDLNLASLRIEEIIVDQTLRNLVEQSFKDQKYEEAVFNAFKHVEERVRAEAGLSSSAIGASLVTDALHYQRGILKISTCHVAAEEEGAYMLFKGAIQLLKNPSSHRTVDWKDPKRAAEAILFADFLLGMLDNAVKR